MRNYPFPITKDNILLVEDAIKSAKSFGVKVGDIIDHKTLDNNHIISLEANLKQKKVVLHIVLFNGAVNISINLLNGKKSEPAASESQTS